MNFRRFLFLFSACAAVSLNAAPSIRIGALRLVLVPATAEADGQPREYLPRSEDADHWTRRAMVQVFKDQSDPIAYLKQAAADVVKTGRFAHYEVLTDPQTREVILDYMTFPPNTAAVQYAEWSLIRARYVAGRGLVVCRYSMRCYDVGPPTAVKVKAERIRMLEPFKAASFDEEAGP